MNYMTLRAQGMHQLLVNKYMGLSRHDAEGHGDLQLLFLACNKIKKSTISVQMRHV
jgi:hypothetical protein